MTLTTNNNLIGSHTDYKSNYWLQSVWLQTAVICSQYDYQLPLRIRYGFSKYSKQSEIQWICSYTPHHNIVHTSVPAGPEVRGRVSHYSNVKYVRVTAEYYTHTGVIHRDTEKFTTLQIYTLVLLNLLCKI